MTDESVQDPILRSTVWQRSFANPIGCAAGFDVRCLCGIIAFEFRFPMQVLMLLSVLCGDSSLGGATEACRGHGRYVTQQFYSWLHDPDSLIFLALIHIHMHMHMQSQSEMTATIHLLFRDHMPCRHFVVCDRIKSLCPSHVTPPHLNLVRCGIMRRAS
jgi:hypothetical protein